jgi:hypothetical protein
MTKSCTRAYWQGQLDALKSKIGVFIDGRFRYAVKGGRFVRWFL